LKSNRGDAVAFFVLGVVLKFEVGDVVEGDACQFAGKMHQWYF